MQKRWRVLRSALLMGALAMLLLPSTATAQFGKRLKDAMKQHAEQKAIEKATGNEDAAIDAATTGSPAAADTGTGATATTVPAVPAPAGSPAVAPSPTAATAGAPTDPALWVNYDFIPGDQVIFEADYSQDAVGNFPKSLKFGTGNVEVAELGDRRLLRATASSVLTIPLPETLPERFTIEIDVINRPSLDGYTFQLQGGPKLTNDRKTSTIIWGSDGAGLLGGGGGEVLLTNDEASRARYRGKPAQLRILGDGAYIKAYLGERRLVNVPNANFQRAKTLTLAIDARSETNPAFVGRIRVAASRTSIYDDLSATGRVATQGILFDPGSDQVRPESTPTLKVIAAMLGEHADLRLRIEGHTDSEGAKAANLDLSGRRASAVKAMLVDSYGIDGGRLEAQGLGDTAPVARNTTAAGRQNNRRVELVRLP